MPGNEMLVLQPLPLYDDMFSCVISGAERPDRVCFNEDIIFVANANGTVCMHHIPTKKSDYVFLKSIHDVDKISDITIDKECVAYSETYGRVVTESLEPFIQVFKAKVAKRVSHIKSVPKYRIEAMKKREVAAVGTAA
jgi:hypothetical protein